MGWSRVGGDARRPAAPGRQGFEGAAAKGCSGKESSSPLVPLAGLIACTCCMSACHAVVGRPSHLQQKSRERWLNRQCLVWHAAVFNPLMTPLSAVLVDQHCLQAGVSWHPLLYNPAVAS